MTITDTRRANAALVGRLSIERCQNHLAHLYALMHLGEGSGFETDDLLNESVLKLMQQIETDLDHSAKAFCLFD